MLGGYVSYAVMRRGVIETIVESTESAAQLREDYDGCDVVPLDLVPEAVKKAYRYWEERP